MKKPTDETIAQAWLGDGVLTLWARLQVLQQTGLVNGERYSQLTCNQFLNAIGEPTAVEASIGRIYRDHGLAAAFEWMDANLLPLFLKQQDTRLRKGKR